MRSSSAFPFVLLRPSVLLALSGLVACKPDAGLTKFNSEPEAQITSPAAGATVLAGTTIALRGAASDPNHDASELTARWFVADAEACAGTPAADGSTTCDVVVPDAEALDVRLEVTDVEGAAGTDTVALVVTPNADPVATIESPLADGVYYSDQLVTFRGTVADTEDAADTLTAWWEDGDTRLDAVNTTPTGSGEVLGYTTLAEGPHALELHVQDTAGNEGIATVLIDVGPPNSSPTCAITAPTSGGASEASSSVAFTATVGDVDIDANLLGVRWSSDKDGDLGSSTADSAGAVSFRTSDLTANDHRITMTVTDEVGATCAAAIDWTVGTPPDITLERPTSGEVVNEGDALTFSALVSDGEDVAGDLLVAWESDVDGVFYEGPPDSSGVAQLIETGLSVGDHVLTVTVTDSDGLYATALGTFSVNGVPTAPGVSISPSSPYTDDELRVSIDTAATDADGDPLTYSYAWSVDGVASGASAASTLPASATTRGEVWTVSVTATDGLAAGAAGTASVMIANTAPVATASLTPSSATRSDTLTCTGSASDLDGDAATFGFTWTVDGVPVTTSSTSSSLSTLAGLFTAGQLVACTVTAADGAGGTDTDTASVTIQNTAPTVSVSLSPSTVYTDGTLTATATTADADGDSLTVTYNWYVDGAVVQSGASSTLVGASYFDRDEVVYVEAIVDDGFDTASATSASITVSNSAPTAPVVEITPADPESGDDLTCSVVTESSDADGDAITYTFAWDVDGTAYASATDSTMESVVDGADVGGGETWTCEVVAGDGDDVSGTASDFVSTDCLPGSESDCAATSCLEILEAGASTGDGVYYLDPDGTGPMQVYCDMTTDGGGWTLIAQGGWSLCGAHTGSSPSVMSSASSMTTSSACSYLSWARVAGFAASATTVRLSIRTTDSSFGPWTAEVYSINALAVSALTSSSGNWHNGAAWTSGWTWAGSSHTLATGWPNMYHSDGTQAGVHWLTTTAHSHVSYGSSYSGNAQRSATWIR